jgi:hypothetical protein
MPHGLPAAKHRAAARTAARATRVLAAAARMTVLAAQSVVVVWGSFPQRVAASGGVIYVAGEHLHDMLLGQRPCLKRTELSALSAANLANLFSSEFREVGRIRRKAGSRPSSDSSSRACVSSCQEEVGLLGQSSSPQKFARRSASTVYGHRRSTA